MKKATSKIAKAVKSTADDVDAYLAKVPEPARTTLGKLRATIRAVVPSEATEGLSYGIPAFHFNGALVGYAAFKQHCSFFPMQASLIDEMQEELKAYRTSKGHSSIPVGQTSSTASRKEDGKEAHR